MKPSKEDTLRLIFEAYVLNILRSLTDRPKRFSELRKDVKTKRTLALKLNKLLDYGLIELVPLETNKRYANYYKLSEKGRILLDKIKKLY
jgi:DNA-binding HxlR family transcriptional regulator